MTCRRPAKRERGRGFTLAELTVLLLIFSLFATTVLATLTLALRFWTHFNQELSAEQTARTAMDVITDELRQALPDTDPGGTNSATGYRSISPAVPPTGILQPNANATSSTQLIFTEPNTANFDPSSSGWVASAPSNFQRVRYYVLNNAVRREQIQYDSSGNVIADTDDMVVTASSTGSVSLSFGYLSADTLNVTVSANEGIKNVNLNVSTRVGTVAQ